MTSSLKTIFNQVYKFIVRPFSSELPLLFALIILLPLSDAFHWWRLGHLAYAIYNFFQLLITVYLLTLITCEVRGSWQKLLRITTLIFGALWCMIDTFCFSELLAPFSDDFAAAVRATTSSEISEFLETFLTPRSLIYLAIEYILAIIGWHIGRKIKIGHRLSLIITLFIIALTIPILRNYSCLIENPFYKTALLFKKYDTISINKFNKESVINIECPDSLIQDVVIIIGESFARDHSSLYGYNLPTNPRLQDLADSGRLAIWREAISGSTNTVESFRCFMGDGIHTGDDWLKGPFIPCAFSEAGYKTNWLSNQSRHGIVDNLISNFAELCDTTVFIGNQFTGLDRLNFDGDLIPHLKRMLWEEKNGLYIVHLIGSHNIFSKRYPSNFYHFTPSDYPNNPESQRQKLAHYDNSILYNDDVVATIMEIFRKRETLVFYFSDHGYDVYKSDSNYIGQGRKGDPISYSIGTQIPMMVYISEAYETRFPIRTEALRKETDKSLCTDTIIRIICRSAGFNLPHSE